MRLHPIWVAGLATLLLQLRTTWTANILFVFPFDMNSQCSLLTPYLQALLDRGHQLTLIHAFPHCSIVEQLHSIYINDRYKIALDFKPNEFWGLTKWDEMNFIRNYMVKTCLNVLDNAEVQQLFQSKKSYDLMIMEPSYTDALFGMAAHFNAKLIGLATSGGDWNINSLVGYTATSTFEPISVTSFKRGITLLDRLYNWMFIAEEWMVHTLIFLPGLLAVHEHFFGHLTQSFTEIRQSFSLILLNQHFSLFDARPNVPSLIEVGGMHVPKLTPQLPPELAQFLDDAPQGVILMTLGTELRSSDLSAATLALILDTFAILPQRIIWKFEGNQRPNASANIYMNEWLPQQAILAHPNVRLFISHGGMLSIIEAVYYAKPVLGMPLFFDQFRNVERMQLEGAALLLDILSLTRQDFESAIRQLLDQPQYRHNVQALSQRFRDQPMHPLDTAVYWTEYILRYKGAPHMRISPFNMKFIDYYCLDNLLFIIVRLSLLIALVAYALHKFRQLLERNSGIFFVFNTPFVENRQIRSD
ncbi:UDP-glucuronosyltransferase 2C1 [Drosophila innubila]|uniref:UDP-glucuronosyltransferase 2C1 n=1 Tax=Drosophila innubila TaxID=198719 RepID=UPI00148DDA7C|nr:UDP-glucuronosyltransferase 2C1 [Drosophila innubila]